MFLQLLLVTWSQPLCSCPVYLGSRRPTRRESDRHAVTRPPAPRDTRTCSCCWRLPPKRNDPQPIPPRTARIPLFPPPGHHVMALSHWPSGPASPLSLARRSAALSPRHVIAFLLQWLMRLFLGPCYVATTSLLIQTQFTGSPGAMGALSALAHAEKKEVLRSCHTLCTF